MTTLHLTTCSDHSRVDLVAADEQRSETFHGPDHAVRSRAHALNLKAALWRRANYADYPAPVVSIPDPDAEVRAFLALWDAGRRAEADIAHAALTPAARRLLDETAQARSERACNV